MRCQPRAIESVRCLEILARGDDKLGPRELHDGSDRRALLHRRIERRETLADLALAVDHREHHRLGGAQLLHRDLDAVLLFQQPQAGDHRDVDYAQHGREERDLLCPQRLANKHARDEQASCEGLHVCSSAHLSAFTFVASMIAVTGPPPAGPCCSAATEQYTIGSPIAAAATAPTTALVWWV